MSRKRVPSNEENSKKRASGSVWSEKDEISLLKGMIDYEVMNQSSPYADMGKFFNFIKPSLHFDVQRKQLTARLWKLKNSYIKSGFDTSKPHHALLLELSKSVKSWGNADMSADGGGESENVASSDDRNGEKDSVDSIGKGKVGISDVPEGKKDDVQVDKSLKMVKNKDKGEIVTSFGQDGENDNVAIDADVHANKGKGLEVVKKNKKRKFVNGDGQNVKEVDVILDDVNCRKSSKLVENKKKGKVVTCDAQTDKEDAVVVEDVVAHDDQNVGQDILVADEVLANKKVPGEVNKKDLKSMYPELTKVLELEILSRMPQQIKKNCVMDVINFMGREKANELEGKWADLRLMELELHAKKLDLANKQINLVLEAVRR